MTEKKSLVKCLLEEQIEFCYTQTSGMYGISKDAIAHMQSTYVPRKFILYCRNKYGVEIVYCSEDTNYMYVNEIK